MLLCSDQAEGVAGEDTESQQLNAEAARVLEACAPFLTGIAPFLSEVRPFF